MQSYDAAREGQWERLKTITALWLKSEPQSSEAIFSNAIAHFELKDFEMAKKQLSDVVKKKSTSCTSTTLFVKVSETQS
jgi:serine protease Do